MLEMPDISKLMLKREHFPVIIAVSKKNIQSVQIPPYHPSMKKNGIDLELVTKDILDNSLEETVKDLEKIAKQGIDVTDELKSVVRDEKGRIIYGELKRVDFGIDKTDFGIHICPFPIIKELGIKRNKISPYGGDKYISIPTKEAVHTSILVPKCEKLSEELIEEYSLIQKGVHSSYKHFSSPYGWSRHNTGYIQGIVYKNLVIAINNAVVKGKYSNKQP